MVFGDDHPRAAGRAGRHAGRRALPRRHSGCACWAVLVLGCVPFCLAGLIIAFTVPPGGRARHRQPDQPAARPSPAACGCRCEMLPRVLPSDRAVRCRSTTSASSRSAPSGVVETPNTLQHIVGPARLGGWSSARWRAGVAAQRRRWPEACAWREHDPDNRAIRMYPSWTPRRRGLGWTLYAWLVYLVFFFAYAAGRGKSVQVVGAQPAGRRGLPAALLQRVPARTGGGCSRSRGPSSSSAALISRSTRRAAASSSTRSRSSASPGRPRRRVAGSW